MSQILDQGVASILSNVLFNIGSHSDTTNSSRQKRPRQNLAVIKKTTEEKQSNEVLKSSENLLTASST
jgi:hypothetical protein